MCKTIRIYRHGETEWNKRGILQGWLDSPLTELGKQQAMAVNWQPEVVYTSDLGRAVMTARLMFPEKPVIQDASLREICLGQWQGQEIAKLKTQATYRSYCEQPEAFMAVTQEPFEQVAERMVAFLQAIRQVPQEKIAVVSHGVSIACLLVAIEKRPISTLWKEGLLIGGDFVTIEYSGKGWEVKQTSLLIK